ncbi:arylalkylamine N-acetyltransferase 1-like [Schistocerca gregaria]|uniref:arylalkylamine N-acetyltransferase 1-like n=1 Tax=Schistocerca gregaria TaxID=7010 RepID=UPI00211EC502|nr:arylalkylamine N-acetyltransferase 1-like [Schistocerca gregaria]
MPSTWKRPADVPFPQVWARCEGKTTLADGSKLLYRIQDITPEMHEEILDKLMMVHFVRDEDLSKTINLIGDKTSLEELRMMWKESLQQNVGLVAIREYPDGQEEIIGANITCVVSKGEKSNSDELKGEAMRKIWRMLMEDLPKRLDVFEHYGVDHYISAVGLTVLPKYRGQNVGLEILRTRFQLVKGIGLKVTATAFTAMASQKQAQRAGYELLTEMAFNDYKVDGKVVFPGMTTPSVKYMGKYIP